MRRGWGAFVAVVLVSAACGTVNPAAATSPSTSYVAWLPLARTGVFPQPPSPSPRPPFPIPAGTPACTASQLHAEMGGSIAATGSNLDMPVVFRNAGSVACVLVGFADVTVLNASAEVLAQAAGATGKGTYFNDGPAVPILVTPGGESFMNLTWYDCTRPRASELAVDLPANGGRVMVPFPVTGNYYLLCDTDPHYVALSRGPFSPVGVQWPPGPAYISTQVSIRMPESVKAGTTLVYFVTVRNAGGLDWKLKPCPDYVEILGPKQAVGTYALNCAPVGHIAPGASVTFEMRLLVPASVPAGPDKLEWTLADGRAAVPHGTATLAIT